MKRHNIYLYEYSNNVKGKSAGFCRMDVYDDSVKFLFNIKCKDLGINAEELVDIKGDLLLEGGNRKQLNLNNPLDNISNYGAMTKDVNVDDIVGVSLTCNKKNGISTRIAGELLNKVFIEEEVKIQDNPKIENISIKSVKEEKTGRIQQVELEDTVYNVDTECLRKKRENTETIKSTENIEDKKFKTRYEKANIRVSGTDYELAMLVLEDIPSLPRQCWKMLRNKFVICGCNRYGHIAYMEQKDRYVICIPGNVDDKCASCARRFGFKSFMPYPQDEITTDDTKDKASGYWMMGMTKNRK